MINIIKEETTRLSSFPLIFYDIINLIPLMIFFKNSTSAHIKKITAMRIAMIQPIPRSLFTKAGEIDRVTNPNTTITQLMM